MTRFLVLLFLSWAACAQGADRPAVAVLVEPGLLPVGGTPALAPERIPELLTKYGLPTRVVSAAQLAGTTRLNPDDFPILILPYGDAYPRALRTALRDYHKAGGYLILDGFPFSLPCRKEGDQWVPMERGEDYGRSSGGLGTGAPAPAPPGPWKIAEGNPLLLEEGALPPSREDGQAFCLDRKSLDPLDEVTPLIEAGEGGVPVAAIVRHRGGDFSGALDVWLGDAAGRVTPEDGYLARQLLVRAAAWCLKDRGRLTAEELQAVFQAAAAEPKPEAFPSALAYARRARPWGETFLPKSARPGKIVAVNAAALSPEEQRALVSLQALTSREAPRIWLNFTAADRFWLDWHVRKEWIEEVETAGDWQDLFRRFAGAYQGAVVPDPALYRGDILAANVAACEDLIVATPELAERLGIPVKVDLRGRFKTYAEGMEWVLETYQDRFNHFLCDMAPAMNGSVAYAMQWRAPIFWPCGPVDALRPGADRLRELALAARILAAQAPNTAMLGFPYAGEGIGIGEEAGVALASGYGVSLVCSDHLNNGCVTSGVALDGAVQGAAADGPALEPDKIYVALALSDGDNENAWTEFFRPYFTHSRHGTFPAAFGMGPAILDLQPGVARWYFERAGEGTEFLADVSGIGSIDPARYGSRYTEPHKVLDGFLDWTAWYMGRLGMKTVRTVSGGDDLLSAYAEKLPALHSIFADVGRTGGDEPLVSTLPGGLPVFRAGTDWKHAGEGYTGFLKEVREAAGAERPAFVNGFVHSWSYGPDALASIYEHRDENMVFVTPAQLARLYRQAQAAAQEKKKGEEEVKKALPATAAPDAPLPLPDMDSNHD
ncbi:MAG: GxGYxYP family putative glycoside hydrolase [Verrucomicrobium sp.]|nr:GxGYxYP family putative glycoside hydrolase [Verrucomicrobium sp.]